MGRSLYTPDVDRGPVPAELCQEFGWWDSSLLWEERPLCKLECCYRADLTNCSVNCNLI